jgi:hypothetical protein
MVEQALIWIFLGVAQAFRSEWRWKHPKPKPPATRYTRTRFRSFPDALRSHEHAAMGATLPMCVPPRMTTTEQQLMLTKPQLSTTVAYMSVVEIASPHDPADGLAAVAALRRLADQMENAEVERAMRAGWSWPQVAEALGVTRQAVHKKHASRLIAAGVTLRRR